MGSSADWLSVYSTEAHRLRPPKVKEQQKLPAKYLEGRDDTAGLGDPYKQKRPDKTENVHLCVSSLYWGLYYHNINITTCGPTFGFCSLNSEATSETITLLLRGRNFLQNKNPVLFHFVNNYPKAFVLQAWTRIRILTNASSHVTHHLHLITALLLTESADCSKVQLPPPIKLPVMYVYLIFLRNTSLWSWAPYGF